MKIYFNGAAHDVTGSQFVLYFNGQSLLIDCGLYQGRESYERNLNFKFNPRGLDAVILTHAHMDHSGNLPNLMKQGYAGPIYTTPATADMADLMLRDSGRIQEDDAEYISKKNAARGEGPIQPLYTEDEAAKVKTHFKPVPYEQEFHPVRGVSARLFDAGHILGSASVCLDVDEGGKRYRLWFSGDIGRTSLPLLKDPVKPQGANYLVMESTYGDTLHPDPDQAYHMLRDVVSKTVQRGGKVIIPAFAVGRTQELVFDLNRMMTAGEIPAIPVYVDSPLAVNVTQVFQKHLDLFDQETQQFVREGRHPALTFKGLVYVESREQSRQIDEMDRPLVVISASGMAENGRIVHHLAHTISDPRNTVVIAGWQAPGTLGRHLLDGADEVRIFGDPYPVKASIVNITGFSAHAGQDQLLAYALASKDTLKEVILVHSEPPVGEKFAELLKKSGIPDVLYPDLYDSIEI